MDKRWLPVLICLPTLTKVVRLIALYMHASLLEELEPQLPIIALLKKRMPYSIDPRSTLHYVDKTSQTVCNWPQLRLTNTSCHFKMLMKLWPLISESKNFINLISLEGLTDETPFCFIKMHWVKPVGCSNIVSGHLHYATTFLHDHWVHTGILVHSTTLCTLVGRERDVACTSAQRCSMIFAGIVLLQFSPPWSLQWQQDLNSLKRFKVRRADCPQCTMWGELCDSHSHIRS